MSKPERRHGVIRISIDSIIKAIYGNTEYKAVNMRISKIDRRMLEITVSHPALPIWKQGQKLPSVIITRRYVQNDKE